ncbi:hypothetical protein SHJG_2427 [Streptomyces hygroscopicus subsp. jinggangensis 5008]|nr:hypothetical protein SHJG_2427 [Streptomyces hygroscopicus subsp. jinggangensis 5008]AGF61858.1 hypothetical protein SHJGH_2192 [Streptomyces hygroscopicus subsp. jinggangensis TL01]
MLLLFALSAAIGSPDLRFLVHEIYRMRHGTANSRQLTTT